MQFDRGDEAIANHFELVAGAMLQKINLQKKMQKILELLNKVMTEAIRRLKKH